MGFQGIKGRIALLILCGFVSLYGTRVTANSLENYPGWSLTKDATDDANEKYYLEPDDGRPAISVTPDAAARMTAGSLHPTDVYKDRGQNLPGFSKPNGGPTAGGEASGGSAFSSFGSSSSSSSSGGSNYVRMNPGAAGVAGKNGAGYLPSPVYNAGSGASQSIESPKYSQPNAATTSAKSSAESGPKDPALKFAQESKEDRQEVTTLTKDPTVMYEESMPPTEDGCSYYTVPIGVTKVKITAIGGGGGGSRSTPTCAYHHLAGAGGAAVVAFVKVRPKQKIKYCVGKAGSAGPGTGYSKGNCGATGGGSGGTSSFGDLVVASGGAGGNAWHYKGKDGRGRPPSAGGTYKVGEGVEVVQAANGESVSSLGACGGNAGLDNGKGGCSSSEKGTNFGGGGYGGGRNYSLGPVATAGGEGKLEITPQYGY